MATVARQVRDYIAGHPSIADALKMDIVNFSALARKISKELGIRRDEAVLAACRRYPVEKLRGYSEDAVRRTLQKSRIQTRTKVATITVVEEMSCYTDTVFILERKDMTRAMGVPAQNLQ